MARTLTPVVALLAAVLAVPSPGAAGLQDPVAPNSGSPPLTLVQSLGRDLRLGRGDRGALAPHVVRTRYVGLRLDRLDATAFGRSRGALERGEAAPRFQLDLFDDVSLVVSVDTLSPSTDGATVSWAGKIEGSPLSSAAIAVTGSVASGNFKTGEGGSFQLRYLSPGVFAVREIDESRFPPESQPIPVTTSPFAAETRDEPVALADDGSIVDVLVVYTPAAQAAAGGQAQIENLIELGITETNQGYANSGVIQRVRLARKESIAYAERSDATTSAFSYALSDLRGTSDSYMTGVHALRDTYGADMVSLWIEASGSCGVGYLMATESATFASAAFSVTARSCATGNYTFAHEMGHNQGSQHDRPNAGSTGVKPYSYGYGKATPNPFRTVMAYEDSCGGGSCPRLNYWSNPAVNSPRDSVSPMGIAHPAANSADNRQSLNDTRVTVSNFRASVSATVPGAPVIGTASALNLSARVTFGPPSSNGGAAITAYKATCGAASATGVGSPITVTGLVNGVAVTCTVQAQNSAGFGPASAASNSVTPADMTIPRLVNLSTRGLVATGDNIMIGGFIVGGSSPKKVIIRGRGPSMASLGVSGTLSDPAIRLFNGATPIDFNDNWQGALNAVEIAASGQALTFPAEAAILTTVNPNVPYTVHVTGVGGTSGIGLVEVFELDKPEIPLLNISTRGPVLTGDNILIGGFIIQGDAALRVLIIAKGPSLGQAPFNVAGSLPDPRLELYSGSTMVESNDNWVDSPNLAAIQATGNAPTSPLESAIIRTLAPGAYTAIVRGVGAFQGIGLIEVYRK